MFHWSSWAWFKRSRAREDWWNNTTKSCVYLQVRDVSPRGFGRDHQIDWNGHCFQLALERHVNNHFNTDNTQNGNNKKSMESGGPVKLFKRNGKKIRFRRQPWSGKLSFCVFFIYWYMDNVVMMTMVMMIVIVLKRDGERPRERPRDASAHPIRFSKWIYKSLSVSNCMCNQPRSGLKCSDKIQSSVDSVFAGRNWFDTPFMWFHIHLQLVLVLLNVIESYAHCYMNDFSLLHHERVSCVLLFCALLSKIIKCCCGNNHQIRVHWWFLEIIYILT